MYINLGALPLRKSPFAKLMDLFFHIFLTLYLMELFQELKIMNPLSQYAM